MNKLIFTFCILLTFSSCIKNPLSSGAKTPSSFLPGLDPAPKIISVSPSQGPFVGGTNITVTGKNFKSGISIKVDNIACTTVTFVSSTSVICQTPAHAMGLTNVLVQNSDGRKYTLNNAFNYVTNVSGVPGLGLMSGGNFSATSASLSMHASIGEPTSSEVMLGTSVQMRVGVQGIMFEP